MSYGYCIQCKRAWTLETQAGNCQWCGNYGIRQTRNEGRTSMASRSRTRPEPPERPDTLDYKRLAEPYLNFYKVAVKYCHKAKAEDTQDLLHDIILTLAEADQTRPDGLKDGLAHRIASLANLQYWRTRYQITNGLTCGNCGKEQRRKCRKDWLYPDCPKAVKVEYLSKPITDAEGHLTELGELIADDKAVDLDAWGDNGTWELGFPKRLVGIAYKLRDGENLSPAESRYLYKYRQKEQKSLF